MSTERPTPRMNAQLRELLCRIPCSPETDELQDFLTVYERTIIRERDEAREREAKWKAECKRQWMHLSQARHNAIAIQNIRWGFDGDCGAARLANLIEEDCDRGMMVSTGKDLDALRSEVEG